MLITRIEKGEEEWVATNIYKYQKKYEFVE